MSAAGDIVITTENAQSDIYAIADVHGRADLLESLLHHIEAVSIKRGTRPAIVFLGDLIDRGPHSPRVLDLVAETLDAYEGSSLILGNHDYFLRQLLRGELTTEETTNWMDWGGVATISAYSDRPVPDFGKIATDIRNAFPHHVDLLENALTYKEIGRFCFVHAGIRPGIALVEQAEYDLRWIRAGFLDHAEPHSHIVVHGHTITASLWPEILANRVALDTGAYRTGRLSAALIRKDELLHFVCTHVTSDGKIQIEERGDLNGFSLK